MNMTNIFTTTIASTEITVWFGDYEEVAVRELAVFFDGSFVGSTTLRKDQQCHILCDLLREVYTNNAKKAIGYCMAGLESSTELERNAKIMTLVKTKELKDNLDFVHWKS